MPGIQPMVPIYFRPETFAFFWLIAKASPHSMACLLRRALITGSIEQAFVGELAILSSEIPLSRTVKVLT